MWEIQFKHIDKIYNQIKVLTESHLVAIQIKCTTS